MSINRTITAMQQSAQVVHVVSERTARALERRGLVRRTVVSPQPAEGVAVNLTVLGKSWRAKSAAPARSHVSQQLTEQDRTA